VGNVSEPTTVRQTEAYAEIARSDDFAELRRRYRGFAFPWTIAFLAWYLLYVICASWATDFMNTKLVGNINVALVFGLLQFASTFVIAWLYSRHARQKLDPKADELVTKFRRAVDR
jgi:uncharacterized membrane protein (DUF485 family)